MPHPVQRLFSHCIIFLATILLSKWSSQDACDMLYTDVLGTDQHLAATTSTYQTTLQVTKILTHTVATSTPDPQGILILFRNVHSMLEGTDSVQLMLKYFTKQPLKAGVNLNGIFAPLNTGLVQISRSNFKQSKNSMLKT